MANQQTLANAQGVIAERDARRRDDRPACRRAWRTSATSSGSTSASLGGRPWRVKVIGHASEWDPGAAMPVEMHGVARPHWLDGRTDALEVAIYRSDQAVREADEGRAAGRASPRTSAEDRSGDVQGRAGRRGEDARRRQGLARASATTRRCAPQLADDVVWSLGGGTGADVAMATWQADPAIVRRDGRGDRGGCAADGDKKVLCPAGAAEARRVPARARAARRGVEGHLVRARRVAPRISCPRRASTTCVALDCAPKRNGWGSRASSTSSTGTLACLRLSWRWRGRTS